MAAYDPTSGDLHPELTKYNPPDALQDWTAETAGAIQDHVTTQAIADQSQEARSQFINGVASSKDDLVGMVRDDPTSAPLAFKLINNFPLDGVQDHFRNQVAVAAVQGYAAHDRDAAHAAVDKYSDYLGDSEAEALKQHADQLDFIRQTDAAGQAVHQRQMMQRLSDASAGGYLNLLSDPNTGAPSFPENWGTQMMQDGRLDPAAKASLFTAYRNLQDNGDPENSDPMAVADLINRAALGYQNPDHPTQPEVLGQVGGNISLADAGFITARLGPQAPAARAQTQQLSDALDTARDQIGNPQAYSRFVNWFMPQARNGGNFDPGSKDYLLTPERMDRFMPTGDDIIAPVVARGDAERPSLSSIFGRSEDPELDQLQSRGVANIANGNAKPGPYVTKLSDEDEAGFQGWIKTVKNPRGDPVYDQSWPPDQRQQDYDMRGYYKAMKEGDPDAQQAANGHFPDTYKTPYHESFSAMSKYATRDAPTWRGNQLYSKSGTMLFDATKHR